MMRVPLVVGQRLHVHVGRHLETLVPKQFLNDLCVIPIRSQERAIGMSQSVKALHSDSQLPAPGLMWCCMIGESQLRLSSLHLGASKDVIGVSRVRGFAAPRQQVLD